MSDKPKFTNREDQLVPILHRLYCECGRELTLPQGKWHQRKEFLWHYKCECGIEMESKMHFPRIEYKLKYGVDVYGNNDEYNKRFSSSGYLIK